MKTKLGIGILLLATLMACAQTNNLTSLLQQGLFEEQANRNLDAAIADYQSLATQFDQDRKIAATAIFRLGECYRAQGKTNEAATKYQRILQDFSDQTRLVALSRQNLAGMGMQAGPAVSAARQRQIELLENQIALAQTNLAEVQKRFQLGTATQSEVTAAEQQAVQLQITLAGLNATPATALNPASPAGSVEDQEIQRIQEMIQNSPDLINAPDSNGQTPLRKAVVNGWFKVATFLLDRGVDVNASGGAALIDATKAGNRAMVEFLLTHGANINENRGGQAPTPLFVAVQRRFEAVTATLLTNKADVNASNSQGDTPLMWAIQTGPESVVRMLLAAGADVNVENNQGRTPLSFAAERGWSEMVKKLLDAKADPNGGKLDAPLLAAVHRGETNSAELLLQAGANPNARGKISWEVNYGNVGHHDAQVTPLFLAVYSENFPMVQLLLRFKADPNDMQTDNRSLLFMVLDKPEIVRVLLAAGAKAETTEPEPQFGQTQYHQTPLQAAVYQNQPETVALLLQYGANPNARDERGDTVLHYAASRPASRNIFTLLLDHDANPNVRNIDGKTPLEFLKHGLNNDEWKGPFDSLAAKKDQLTQLITLLHQHGALDNLPDWDSIKISLPDANYTDIVFRKGTNNWNHFTLLELIYH